MKNVLREAAVKRPNTESPFVLFFQNNKIKFVQPISIGSFMALFSFNVTEFGIRFQHFFSFVIFAEVIRGPSEHKNEKKNAKNLNEIK